MRCDQFWDQQSCSLAETPQEKFKKKLMALIGEHEDDVSARDFIDILGDAIADIAKGQL